MAATDDSDIPESGAVFTFGKSRFAENLPNKFWVKNDRVLQVACGDEHTALVAESGRVFMFGPNDYGQLGIGPQKIANRPTCIKSLKHEKSRLVACGRSHTIVATESGNIYTFGGNGEGQLGVEGVLDSNVPKHVESLQCTQWKMLAAGCDHSMALTEDGRVFVWGGSSEGQLGLGEETEVPEPRQLDIGQPVTCIACGYYHSALVTESGDLYTFGESDGGKLGLGDDTDESTTPQHVMAINDRVKSVSCGGSHTIAITEKGEAYVFGGGSNGQLGLGVTILESESPSLLKVPFKVSRVCCGENFSAVISERGQLYTFGDGRHGKLALGQESFSNQFMLCNVDRFQKFKVTQVACGGCHMIVTAVPKVHNDNEQSDGEEEGTAMLNGTVRDSTNLNLSRTFSARDRRRNASPLPLHRTLPPLGNNRALPALNATLPAIKMSEQKVPKTEPAPRLQRTKKIDKMSEEEESEEEASDEEAKDPKPKASSRTVPPMPSQENGLQHHSDEGDKDDKSNNNNDDDEEEEEEAAEEAEEDSSDQKKDQQSDEEKEKEEEEDESQVDTVAKNTELTPKHESEELVKSEAEDNGNEADSESEEEEQESKGKKKKEEKKKEEEEGEEEAELEEEAAQVDLRKGPMPVPRKVEEEEEEEKEEEEDSGEEEKEEEKKEKDKKKNDKKGKEDKKKDKKKDKKDKKKKGKKDEDEEDEDEEEEKDKEEEKDDKKKKGKDKKKEKEDKKKKGKKDKEDEEEEEEEEEEDKGKGKKKDKDKKKKKGDKGEDDEDKEKDENENEEEKGDGDKSKEEPKPKKKSKFCTVL